MSYITTQQQYARGKLFSLKVLDFFCKGLEPINLIAQQCCMANYKKEVCMLRFLPCKNKTLKTSS